MDKENLVKKWLNDELSETEAKAFNALDDANLCKEIIEEAQRFKGQINAKVTDFNQLDTALVSKTSTSINWLKIVSGIAAVLVVSFALFTVLNKDNLSAFTTEIAQNETIILPDNSIVNLNELSHIEYLSSNWKKNRSLDLKGEAFFDVEKGKRFDVHTSLGTISVLGTEFNVLSRDSIFKVSCYEGLVQVTYDTESVKIPAGTEFILSLGKGTTSSIVTAEPYWLKNMSVFENVTFKDVIDELEKQYHITVQYPTEYNVHFTGAFEHNNLENALKSITNPLGLTYTIQHTNQVIIRNGQN